MDYDKYLRKKYGTDNKPYREKTGKYLVTYSTKYGGRGVLNVYKTKASAKKAIKEKSGYFKARGYSNPRIKLNR